MKAWDHFSMSPAEDCAKLTELRRKGRAGCAALLACVTMLVAATVHCGAAAPPAEELVVRVAPVETVGEVRGGPDKSGPRASSIEEAIAITRRWRKAHGPDVRIAIELLPGRHRLVRSVRLGAEDSGGWSTPLVIRGVGGAARVEVSGAVALAPVGGLEPHPRISEVPESVRPRIQRYRLPMALARVPHVEQARFHAIAAAPVAFEIFDALGALRPARWPNEGWARTAAVRVDYRSLAFSEHAGPEPRQLASWSRERDLWLAGYPRYDWSYETLRIGAVDAGSGRIVTADQPRYGLADGRRVAVVHALGELDHPGEWYRDVTSGEVLIIPRNAGEGGIEASVADSAFVLDKASHVTIEGITFTRFRGDAVTVEGGSGVVLDRVRISWVGGRAAVFHDTRAGGVSGAIIESTGEGGVVVEGGDRPTLTSGGLVVVESRFTNFSRLGVTYKPAIAITGVGARVVGNIVTDGPHMAISFSGNDHEIAENVIARVVTDANDAGAIYTGRDWTARGTVIRANVLCDIRAAPGFEVKGIYLDDFASGMRVENNLFLRVDQPIFIGGGRDNVITRNVLIASAPAVHVDARGLSWARASVDDHSSELRRALAAMPLSSASWRARMPTLAGLLADQPHLPKGNVIADNVIVGPGETVRLQQVPPHLVDTTERAVSRVVTPSVDVNAGLVAIVDDLSRIEPKIERAILTRLQSQIGMQDVCRGK